MYTLITFICAIIAATIHLAISRHPLTFKRFIDIYLAYILPVSIGLMGIIGFIAHIFYGPETAKMIGWPPNNPFQLEIGMANLAMGVAGILCIWFRKRFWLATVIFSGIFILGAAHVHMIEMEKGNFAPYNSGVFLYVGDILIPIIYIILTCVYFFQHRLYIRS